MLNKDKVQAYKDLLEVLKTHNNIFDQDSPAVHQAEIESRIKMCELSEEFSIEFDITNYHEYSNIGCDDNRHLVYMDGVIRTIAWPDDGEQPKGEYLYHICYPCGAYTFSEDYPTETFKAFFEELKSYNPRYIDSRNKSLYFDSKTAKAVHDNYKEIFSKYKAMVQSELDKRKIEKLKSELAKLEGK